MDLEWAGPSLGFFLLGRKRFVLLASSIKKNGVQKQHIFKIRTCMLMSEGQFVDVFNGKVQSTCPGSGT